MACRSIRSRCSTRKGNASVDRFRRSVGRPAPGAIAHLGWFRWSDSACASLSTSTPSFHQRACVPTGSVRTDGKRSEIGQGTTLYTAQVTAPATVTTASGRLDRTLSDIGDNVVRYSRAPSRSENGFLQRSDTRFTSQTFTAGVITLAADSRADERCAHQYFPNAGLFSMASRAGSRAEPRRNTRLAWRRTAPVWPFRSRDLAHRNGRSGVQPSDPVESRGQHIASSRPP